MRKRTRGKDEILGWMKRELLCVELWQTVSLNTSGEKTLSHCEFSPNLSVSVCRHESPFHPVPDNSPQRWVREPSVLPVWLESHIIGSPGLCLWVTVWILLNRRLHWSVTGRLTWISALKLLRARRENSTYQQLRHCSCGILREILNYGMIW